MGRIGTLCQSILQYRANPRCGALRTILGHTGRCTEAPRRKKVGVSALQDKETHSCETEGAVE